MPAGLKPDRDARWMRLAVGLAKKSSIRRTAPNPRVACILVKNNAVIAHGVHELFGGLHAEALALKRAGNKARGATAYVTLEPCCHAGKKTPPCCHALIQAGIRRVVVACLDANPNVDGRSMQTLARAGIETRLGVLESQAHALNRFFFHWIRTARPWVTLKMASGLDGKITSTRRWISNPAVLKDVQRLRAQYDAILVGKNTIVADNPRLTVRKNGRALAKKDQPLRVILDSRLALDPERFQVFKNGPVLVACTRAASGRRRQRFEKAGIDAWAGSANGHGHVRLDALVADLGRRGIRSVLVEGGAQIATEFLQSNLLDDAYFDVAPLLSGGRAVELYRGSEKRFSHSSVRVRGDDAVFHVVFSKQN